jgi:hypothetical protein
MNELFSLVVLKASSGGRQKLAFFLAGRGPPWPNYKENNLGYLFFPSKPRREKTQKKKELYVQKWQSFCSNVSGNSIQYFSLLAALPSRRV